MTLDTWHSYMPLSLIIGLLLGFLIGLGVGVGLGMSVFKRSGNW